MGARVPDDIHAEGLPRPHLLESVHDAQVTAGFAPDIARAGAASQAPLLAKLAGALDRVSDLDLARVRFMLGREYGIDAQGRLWLDVVDSMLMWAGCAAHLSSGKPWQTGVTPATCACKILHHRIQACS